MERIHYRYQHGKLRFLIVLMSSLYTHTEHVIQAEALDCALDLMRRLPPSKTEHHLSHILELCPDLTEDLLSAVDQPLKIARCSVTGKEFLLCDYNRDGDSYR